MRRRNHPPPRHQRGPVGHDPEIPTPRGRPRQAQIMQAAANRRQRHHIAEVERRLANRRDVQHGIRLAHRLIPCGLQHGPVGRAHQHADVEPARHLGLRIVDRPHPPGAGKETLRVHQRMAQIIPVAAGLAIDATAVEPRITHRHHRFAAAQLERLNHGRRQYTEHAVALQFQPRRVQRDRLDVMRPLRIQPQHRAQPALRMGDQQDAHLLALLGDDQVA